jgi:hypothetical protein
MSSDNVSFKEQLIKRMNIDSGMKVGAMIVFVAGAALFAFDDLENKIQEQTLKANDRLIELQKTLMSLTKETQASLDIVKKSTNELDTAKENYAIAESAFAEKLKGEKEKYSKALIALGEKQKSAETIYVAAEGAFAEKLKDEKEKYSKAVIALENKQKSAETIYVAAESAFAKKLKDEKEKYSKAEDELLRKLRTLESKLIIVESKASGAEKKINSLELNIKSLFPDNNKSLPRR